MTEFTRDLRLSLRQIIRQPTFALIVVVTIAVAIGANAAVFSLADALIFRPFPLPDIDRLVQLWGTIPKQGVDRDGVSPANLLDWKAQTSSFERLVAYEWWDVNMAGAEQPERVQGTLVSPGFLDALGIQPIQGRTLLADEKDPEARTVVLSHRLWSRQFANDPAILGKTLLLNGELYEVVGIAPAGFDYPWGSVLWAPLHFDPETAAVRDWSYLSVIGRLKEGVSVQDAQGEMQLIAGRLEREHPETNSGKGIRAQALNRAVIDMGTPAFVAVFQSTVLFILLIACVNVANLLLARGSDRKKELSLKLALGAGRFRIIRQLLTENLVLSSIGATLAMPLAWIGIELLRNNLPARIARFVVGWDQIDLDWRVLIFTGGVAILTALVFGLLPALQATRPDLAAALKEGGRGGSDGTDRQRSRSALVVAEVAVTLMLLVASGLSIRGTLRLLEADQGYDPNRLMTMQITLTETKYEDESKRRQFYQDILAGIRELPQVVKADAVNSLPSSGSGSSRNIEIESQPIPHDADRPWVDFRVVTPGYFETMRIPLVAGRSFTEHDREDGLQVAIISDAMREKFWPDTEPIGKRFRTDQEAPWLTIVGVAGDVTHDWFIGRSDATFYQPFLQKPRWGMALVVRTGGEPSRLSRRSIPTSRSTRSAL
jgi:putative ABC transport system permease protein